MDEFLAELYGTRETIGAGESDTSDLDKLAEAQILDNMFEAEGINVEELPDEAILKMAHQLFGDNSALVKEAMEGAEKEEEETEEEETPEEEAKEEKEEAKEASEESFSEKLAQADQLGRVMAHAFVQEQSEIEKQAAAGAAGKFLQAGLKKGKKLLQTGKKVGEKAGKKALKAGKKAGKKYGPAAGAGAGVGLGVGGLAGYLAGKDKKGSALDMLAEERALEMLKEAGIDIAEQQQPEVSSREEMLKAAVDARALEMLVEAGYVETEE